MEENYLIDLVFKNVGEEGEGISEVSAETMNLLVKKINESLKKIVNIATDDNGTHINSPAFINGYEVVTESEHPDPSK